MCFLVVVGVVNVDDLVDRRLLAVLLDEAASVALRLQLEDKTQHLFASKHLSNFHSTNLSKYCTC